MPELVIGVCACPGIGHGRALTELFSRQKNIETRFESRPLLPWGDGGHTTGDAALKIRCQRLRKSTTKPRIIDIGAHYYSHLERILSLEPDVKVVHLSVTADQVVEAFQELSLAQPYDYDHWSDPLTPQVERHPEWTRTFPKYPVGDRETSIRRYVPECDQAIELALKRFPGRVHTLDLKSMGSKQGVGKLLRFIGIPPLEQVVHLHDPSRQGTVTPHPRRQFLTADRQDPGRCVILVPFSSHIYSETEKQLRKLEERGYEVRRHGGISAIDQGRSQMATDALADGFDETLWIDSDMSFAPEAVDQLRSHGERMISGLYAKKGVRSLASQFPPGTKEISMGKSGGVIEITYAATGFLLVHRSVYTQIQDFHKLPVCNELFKSRPIIPFFQPMTIPHEDAHWYIGEDYAFSHRALTSGIRILADTSIRLWHIGNYAYGWEDAGADVKRFDSYHFSIGS